MLKFQTSNQYPPKLFLWHLFRAVVISCWHLENGKPLYENQGDDPNWEEEFVHRDLFLADSRIGDVFEDYLRLKVADFSLGIFAS